MAFAILSVLRSLFRRAGAFVQAASRSHNAPAHTAALRAAHGMRAAPTPKPLRIVHKGAGRLVISGRMADVCAELERLAALEALGGQALLPSR